jgi:fatty-acyl-CoA synthase
MSTYIDDVVGSLESAGPRTVLRHAGTDTSGATLLSAIRRYARALDGLGVGRGDLVALLAPNTPDALAVRYAAHVLGAAAVFLSVPPAAHRRAQLVAQLAPQLLVVFPETAQLTPRVQVPVVSVGPVPGDMLRLDRLAARCPDAALPVQALPDDLAVVISSGGTTGVPKGSRRTFAAYTANVTVPHNPGRRQLANGKLAYLTQILVDQTLLGGGTVVLQDGYEPLTTLTAIQDERITHLFLVEPQLFELMDHPAVADHDLSSLRTLTHIGAAAAPVLRHRARATLGPVVMHTYGASEMGIVSALTPAEHDRPSRFRSAGRIQPGVDVRFRRADGTLHPSTGTIEVRSPAMAQGYRNRPADEAEHFTDGWYRTGDLGELDTDGMLRIDGRTSDIAALGGAAPVDVQDTLCRQPSVRYAVVFGPEGGDDAPLAAVEPWPGGHVDLDACRAALTTEHGARLTADLHLLPVAAVPRTEQGKPDRLALTLATTS